MIHLGCHAAIIIPDGVLPKVINEINDVTAAAGGVTKTEVRGEWLSDDGIWVNEHGTRYEWYWRTGCNPAISLIIAMLRAGEESVMMVTGTIACLFTREDFPESFSH